MGENDRKPIIFIKPKLNGHKLKVITWDMEKWPRSARCPQCFLRIII